MAFQDQIGYQKNHRKIRNTKVEANFWTPFRLPVPSCVQFLRSKLRINAPNVIFSQKGEKFHAEIWMFPKIGVPPNHPF